jgi:hypothetical protein
MAYKNLVAQAFSTRAEAFKRIRDWICMRNGSYDYSTTGLGWTLHDSYYATSQDAPASGDWFVVYSAGESTKEDLYYRFYYSATSGQIQVQLCQYWDASGNTAVNGQTLANNLTIPESTAGTLYIYGDLDTLCVFTLSGANQYACLFGMVNSPFYDRTVATCSSIVSSGSSVVVAMDVVPSAWAIGGKVVIRDNANMERIIISDINSLNVTFTNIVTSYSAGCKFSQDYPVFCQNTATVNGAYVTLFSHTGTKMTSHPTQFVLQAITSSCDPDAMMGDYLAVPFEIYDTTYGYYGYLTNVLSIPSTGYTHLGVYTTPAGVNYRAIISMATGIPMLFKEV